MPEEVHGRSAHRDLQAGQQVRPLRVLRGVRPRGPAVRHHDHCSLLRMCPASSVLVSDNTERAAVLSTARLSSSGSGRGSDGLLWSWHVLLSVAVCLAMLWKQAQQEVRQHCFIDSWIAACIQVQYRVTGVHPTGLTVARGYIHQ